MGAAKTRYDFFGPLKDCAAPPSRPRTPRSGNRGFGYVMISRDAKTTGSFHSGLSDSPGPAGGKVRADHRQHHARSGAGGLRAGAGALVGRQPAHLFPVEAGRPTSRTRRSTPTSWTATARACASSPTTRPSRRRPPAAIPRGTSASPSTRAMATSSSTTTPPARRSRSPRPPTPKTNPALPARRQAHLLHARQQPVRDVARDRHAGADDRYSRRRRGPGAPRPPARRRRGGRGGRGGAAPPRPPPASRPRAPPARSTSRRNRRNCSKPSASAPPGARRTKPSARRSNPRKPFTLAGAADGRGAPAFARREVRHRHRGRRPANAKNTIVPN